LARRTTIRLEDLSGEVLINNGSHEAQRALIQRDMVGAGHDVGHIIQADGLESTLLLCSVGKGVCIVADHIVPTLPLSLNLIYIPLEKGEINAPIVVLYPRENTNPLVSEFLKALHTFDEYTE
jgi:DNA-binding transcriptional LysR family regulator